MSHPDRHFLAALACGLAMATAAPVLELTGLVPFARLGLTVLAGVLAVVLTARGPWAQTGRWSAVAMAGSAASLELIFAGTTPHYQHFLDWPRLLDRPWAVLVLVAQAVVVAAGWLSEGRAARLWRGVAGTVGGLRAVVFVGAVWMLSATLNRDVAMYVRELVTGGLIHLLQLATLGLAAVAAPVAAAAPVGEDPNDRHGPALGPFEWSVAGLVVVTCLALNHFVYERHPHVPDEVQYLFQARYLAEGRIAVDVPPVPRAFESYLTTASPQGWYSVVPPGWPAVLAVGAAVGAEDWVNPVLSGANVLFFAILLQGWYGRRVRRIGVLLLAASPWQLFLGMSYMPQAATLTVALLAALGVERARRTDQAVWAWLGGGALGFLAMVRQLDALIAAAALGLWALGLGGRRLRLPAIAGLVLGAMMVGAVLLPYNAHFTGQGSRFPIMVYNDRIYGPGTNDYGFGANRGVGWGLDPRPGHDVIDGLINTNLNLTATEVELFGWGAGSLAFVLFLVVGGVRLHRTDRAMLAMIAIVWAAYFANYFSGGPDFGARYWYLMLAPLVALSARAVVAVDDLTGGGRRIGTVMAAVATAVAVVTFVPWRATDKYFHYRAMRPDMRQFARDHQFGRALVVINGNEHPDYTSASTYNPLDWTAPVPIYAYNRDAATLGELRQAFPDRPMWILDGPTKTGNGYRVVAGPIAPGAPLPALDPPP